MPLPVSDFQDIFRAALSFTGICRLCEVRFVRCSVSTGIEASDGEKRLYAHLLTNASYNREIRPRRDPTQTVFVDVELNLNHLIKLVRHII